MSDVQNAQQPQQAAEPQRAPQSPFEADAPRIERDAKKPAEPRFRDWASI